MHIIITNLFYIGTGKSTLGVHLAYTFAKLNQITKMKAESKSEKSRCVVYCSASDSSLDIIASTYVLIINLICMYRCVNMHIRKEVNSFWT